MKDSAPKELGIVAVAALFGLIALVVSYAVLNFAGFASCLIGILVAIVTAIALWFGWREPAAGPTGPRNLSPNAGETNTTAPAPTPAAPVTPKPAAAPAQVATPAAAPAATFVSSQTASVAEPAPVMKTAKPAAKPAAVKTAKATNTKAAKLAVKATTVKAAKPAAAKAAPVAADGKPDTLTTARASGADDLKQIKGVGPQLEKTLNALGFYHFDQVAAWRKKEVEWVDSRLKFKGRIVRDDWIKQAKKLAKG